MRIFIALDIPAGIRARMLEYSERTHDLAPEARWARPEGLHITLKFIGETSEERVQQVRRALVDIKVVPFEVKFTGVGFFPTSGRRVCFGLVWTAAQHCRNWLLLLTNRWANSVYRARSGHTIRISPWRERDQIPGHMISYGRCPRCWGRKRRRTSVQ